MNRTLLLGVQTKPASDGAPQCLEVARRESLSRKNVEVNRHGGESFCKRPLSSGACQHFTVGKGVAIGEPNHHEGLGSTGSVAKANLALHLEKGKERCRNGRMMCCAATHGRLATSQPPFAVRQFIAASIFSGFVQGIQRMAPSASNSESAKGRSRGSNRCLSRMYTILSLDLAKPLQSNAACRPGVVA
jgi:hypothetical protein